MKTYEVFKKYDINLSDEQVEKFDKYYHYLVEENEKFNLTAITEESEVLYKHFLDSALPEKFISQNAKIIDIGSGAGFPAIPLKIVRDDLDVVMVDSLNKRVNFLNETIKILNMKDIVAVHSRAEDFVKETRETFDYAVARAVASLNTLLEYLVPYIKVGGKCLIYKSQRLDEEIKEAENALKVLNCKIVKIEDVSISEIEAERKILIIEKLAPTAAKYPRGKNLPKVKPL